MKISSKTWQNYIKRLAKINTKAAGDVVSYMVNHDVSTYEGTKALIDYAHAVSTKYGEAAAELSCQMYDAIATVSKASVPAAEPAATATYGEIAKTIYGTLASTKNPDAIGSAVGRSVKLASVDTLQKNALRDGAEWAWIPAGDTCPFCLMLASNGWQKASKKAIKNGHADHIHNNCDCTYCVRFDHETTVEGYDPDALYDQYINAGETASERINALRRQHYAANKDYINAQKRAAYARRNIAEKARLKSSYSNIVQEKALDTERFVNKFEKITNNKEVNRTLHEEAVEMLKRNSGTNHEDLVLIDANSGKVILRLTGSRGANGVSYDDNARSIIQRAHEDGKTIISLHNHPNGLPPTLDDGSSALAHGYDYGIAVGHNLEVYVFTPADNVYTTSECGAIHEVISESAAFSIEFEDSIWYNALREFGMKIRRIK